VSPISIGGVSILCWLVTPAVSPFSKSVTEQSAINISVPKEQTTVKTRRTQAPGYTRDKIKFLGGVSILWYIYMYIHVVLNVIQFVDCETIEHFTSFWASEHIYWYKTLQTLFCFCNWNLNQNFSTKYFRHQNDTGINLCTKQCCNQRSFS
jgi:hypothetical protein